MAARTLLEATLRQFTNSGAIDNHKFLKPARLSQDRKKRTSTSAGKNRMYYFRTRHETFPPTGVVLSTLLPEFTSTAHAAGRSLWNATLATWCTEMFHLTEAAPAYVSQGVYPALYLTDPGYYDISLRMLAPHPVHILVIPFLSKAPELRVSTLHAWDFTVSPSRTSGCSAR